MTNEIKVAEDLSVQLMSDEGMFNRVNQMANMMSTSKAIPQHLRDDHGACFNVVIQAIQWKMNPFAVAQKTHSIKGNIGYEAQLINAVVNAHAPIEGPIDYEFFGPWENILGKFDVMTNAEGKMYNKSVQNKDAEKGCGVRAWATLKGESKPRVIELFMSQCPVRNSTNWANDPQQQLVYMAQKKWARRFCPEVILGVYSADEMPEETKAVKKSATEALNEMNSIKKEESIDISATTVDSRNDLSKLVECSDEELLKVCQKIGNKKEGFKVNSLGELGEAEVNNIEKNLEYFKQEVAKL